VTAPAWSRPGYAAVAEVIARRAGLIFPQARVQAAEAAINQAMTRRGIGGLSEYRTLLDTEAAVRDELLAELTIGETYFFRDPAQLGFVRDTILPSLAREDISPIRIWSAACASGEEAYSVSIICQELGLLDRVHIYATDLSRPRLETARRARYTRWSLRGVPEEVIRKFFTLTNKVYQLQREIRNPVDFGYVNLAEDHFPSLSSGICAMDVILCRNVLIYFDRDTIARVAQGLIDSLSPRGWLIVGASDPMISDYVDCEVEVTLAGLAYRRHSAERPARSSYDAVYSVPADLFATEPQYTHEEPADTPAPPQPATRARGNTSVDQSAATEPGVKEQSDADRVRVLANAGRLHDAALICAAALDSAPPTAELLYLQAVLLAEANRPLEAAQIARKALYLDRGFIVAHLALGQALARTNDVQGAARAYRNAVDLLVKAPDDMEVTGSGGESAGRLRELVNVQLSLLEAGAT
jgi:chemotaxis protein methyltransferase CheR